MLYLQEHLVQTRDQNQYWIERMAPVAVTNQLPSDENIGTTLIAVTGVLTALTLLTTSCRVWVRYQKRILGWDDYTIIAVTLLATVRMAIQAAQVDLFGNGRHRWFLTEDQYMNNNMLGWYAQILLFATVCLLKISICLLMLRIKNDGAVRILMYIVMGGMIISSLGCIIVLLAECHPIEAYWKGNGTCWDTRVRIYVIYFTISFSLLTDAICSMLPMVIIWKVQIRLLRKVSLCCLMGLGLIATGFGIVRAASLRIQSDDLSWHYCITAIWSNLELLLGILGANLAVSRSIYVYFRWGKDNLGSSTGHSGLGYRASRSGYINQSSQRREDLFPSTAKSKIISTNRRRPSLTQSEDSDIPLEPGVIHRRMDYSITEEHNHGDMHSGKDSQGTL
ncbi:hypothetical protein F5B20DRAFT_552833 [Whalleya microplaca]|nr:hypothetical protein F5B20DRAFT_552833 [Whalleya microplaca]